MPASMVCVPDSPGASPEAAPDSAHTHGGQMLEMMIASELMKANDRTYGIEKRNNTSFIVTSGIADWAIKFKTGTFSEYCIINVTGKL